MILRILLCCLAFLAAPVPRVAPSDPTPRAITLQVDIATSRAELFRLWTTTAGVKVVFPGADARIDARVGGAYCVIFAPEVDPSGDSLGTNGCVMKELVPDSRVVFEWRGKPDMPAMNARPFPTKVTLDFQETAAGRTHVTLKHDGFGNGPEWDAGYSYFEGAWKSVLDGLTERFASPSDLGTRLASLPKTETLYVVHLAPGSNWIAGKSPGEQPKILNHLMYMERLYGSGALVMGGRLGDDHGLAILRVSDRSRAERLLAADPAVLAGTFAYTIDPWTTFVRQATSQEKAGETPKKKG